MEVDCNSRDGSPEIFVSPSLLRRTAARLLPPVNPSPSSSCSRPAEPVSRNRVSETAESCFPCFVETCPFTGSTQDQISEHFEMVHVKQDCSTSRPVSRVESEHNGNGFPESPMSFPGSDSNNSPAEDDAADVVCPICPFKAKTEYQVQFHIETAHSNGESSQNQPGPSRPSTSKPLYRRVPPPKPATTSPVEPPAKRPRVESTDEWLEKAQRRQDEMKCEPKREASVENGRSRRYPKRIRTANVWHQFNQGTYDTTVGKEEFTQQLRRIITGNAEDFEELGFETDDFRDHRVQLRGLAVAIEKKLGDEWEVSYERASQLKDGYVAMFIGRLQSLLSEDDDGNLVLTRISDLLNEMNESLSEYQQPDTKLMDALRAGAANGKEAPAMYLCNEVLFFGRDLGDSGWGCGYRNAQMLISSLLKWPRVSEHLQKELGSNEVPNIFRLQELIARSWERGFGEYSSADLDFEVIDTSKWIGTAEIHALFSSMHLECKIIDFASGDGNIVENMVNFVYEYFVERTGSFVPPMFIQYSGHSRTIVGVDVTGSMSPAARATDKMSDKIGLLIFDPSDSQHSISAPKKPTRKWFKEHFHCPLKSFKEGTYQILFFTGDILSDQDYERMKKPGEGHVNICM